MASPSSARAASSMRTMRWNSCTPAPPPSGWAPHCSTIRWCARRSTWASPITSPRAGWRRSAIWRWPERHRLVALGADAAPGQLRLQAVRSHQMARAHGNEGHALARQQFLDLLCPVLVAADDHLLIGHAGGQRAVLAAAPALGHGLHWLDVALHPGAHALVHGLDGRIEFVIGHGQQALERGQLFRVG